MRSRSCPSLLIALVLLLGGLTVKMPDHVAAVGMCFQETGHCIQGRFLAYWQEHGGLAINGYPLSDERQELLEDGHTYMVQYFERVRMEYHPENAPPYDILLGQFGRRILQLPGPRNFPGVEPAAQPLPGQVYFAETGHNLGGPFLAYWQQHGGLAQFGFPLTEESSEQLGSQFYRVQYFERARLELHPENTPPYDVLLGQFGRAMLAQTELLSGTLGRLYITTERVRLLLGQPAAAVIQAQGVAQEFEEGWMLYRGDQHHIYVLCGDPGAGRLVVSGTYPAPQTPYFVDTWTAGQEPGGGLAPKPGLFLPQRGFGQVWREHQAVRDCLGYARTADETAYPQAAQDFELGVLLTGPDGESAYAFTTEFFSGGGIVGRYERFAAPAR